MPGTSGQIVCTCRLRAVPLNTFRMKGRIGAMDGFCIGVFTGIPAKDLLRLGLQSPQINDAIRTESGIRVNEKSLQDRLFDSRAVLRVVTAVTPMALDAKVDNPTFRLTCFSLVLKKAGLQDQYLTSILTDIWET